MKELNIDIDNYISTNINILDKYPLANKILIISDTNTGKTKSMLGYLSKLNMKIGFLVPMISLVQQIENEYSHLNLQCLYNKKKYIHNNQLNQIIVSSWDSSSKYDGIFDLIVRDEIHSISSSMDYRYKGISQMDNVINDNTKIIDITATDDFIDKDFYDLIIRFNKINLNKTEPKIVLCQHLNDNKNISIINFIHDNININSNDDIHIVLRNNRQLNLDYQSTFKKYYNIDFEEIYSGNKDESIAYNNIINDNMLFNNKKIISTHLFTNGLNIYNEDYINIYMIDDINPLNIKQISARFRYSKSITIYIFKRIKDGYSLNKTTYKNIINIKIKQAKLKIEESYFANDDILFNEYGISNYKGNYQINMNMILYLSQRTFLFRLSFKEYINLLNKYFTNIEIFAYDEVIDQSIINSKIKIKEIKYKTLKYIFDNKPLNDIENYDKKILNEYKFLIQKYNHIKILPHYLTLLLVTAKITKMIYAKNEIENIRKYNKKSSNLTMFIYNEFKLKKTYNNNELKQLYIKIRKQLNEPKLTDKKIESLLNIYCDFNLIKRLSNGMRFYVIKIYSFDKLLLYINKNKNLIDNKIIYDINSLKSISKLLIK